MGKKTRLRGVLACMLAAAMTLGGVATTLAAPAVAEAYPSYAIRPTQSKSDLTYDKQYQPVKLAGGKNYVFGGNVDIYYYEVEGGTAKNPTRLYFSNSSSLGGSLTDTRDVQYSQHPLFVLMGGYVEFIGDSGTSTEVRCDGKTFLSDSADYDRHGGVDKPNTGESLNLTVRDLKLVSRTGTKGDSGRAILLYGTMGKGETATFTNVNVSDWDCARNAAGSFGNVASDYVASPAPVTIRGCNVAVAATFNNCIFEGNCDDCVGALSVVGRAKRPKVTLNGCTFKNNYHTMIGCDALKIESVESGHVHSGNIGVKNADVTLSGCDITSGPNSPWWRGPSAYMENGYDMHMTSGLAVAKDATCMIDDTVIDDSYSRAGTDKYGKAYSIQDAKRSTVYALGSVTLAGNTKITSTVAKGLDASGVNYDGKLRVDKSFTGEAVLSVDDARFDSKTDPRGYYYAYVDLGTSDLSQEDLASRLKLANADVAYQVTDGRIKVIHRRHEHAWNYSVNADGYSIKATCNGPYEALQCGYSRDGDTISLMSSKSGDLSFTYNGKARDVVLDTTKPSQTDNAVAQGKVKIAGARFYRCADENDTTGLEMEGSVPTDAGCYRVVATVSIEGQDDVTLERLFQIKPASLAEKDSERNALCKIEVIGYDKLKDGVKFRGDTFNGVPSYTWTGEEITPRIKVTYKLGGEWIELREGIDFERLEWGESVSEKDPGVYRSQIWGLGNYVYGPFFYWTICGTQFENVQAKGFEGTYDGECHVPSVTVDNAPSDMRIEYSSDGGSTWSVSRPAYKDVARDSSGDVIAKTVKYRVTATDYVPVEGEMTIKIIPADQVAPEDVRAAAASGHGLADGLIEGVDDTCEWKVEGKSGYQKLAKGQTEIRGLSAGKYAIRRKADNNHNVSDAVTVEVKDGPKKGDGTGWKCDDAEHWNTCTCGKEDVDRAKHSFEWIVDQKPTATEAGSKHEQCTVCGYARAAVEIPAASVGGYNDVYDGKWHTVDTKALPEGVTVEYNVEGGETWTTEAPKIKDAGSMKAGYRATVDGVEVKGEVELAVAPRPLALTATNASKVYGEADPELGYTVTGGSLVEGESLDGITVAREKGEAVRDGGYAINVSQEKDANSNYDVALTPGVFTISKRPLTVTWGSTDFIYDGASHVPSVTLGNVLAGEKIEATVEGVQIEANRTGETYTATVTGLKGAAAGNYALPPEGLSRTFTIKNAPQDAPQVQAGAESISGKHDGKIAGVDATMEWRAADATAYQAVSGDAKELTGLAPGTYLVRYRAKANHDASPDTEVTVAAGRKLKVTLPTGQTGYMLTSTATELDWHGSATLAMSIDGAYFTGKDFAVRVNGKKVDLAANGTYELKGIDSDVNVTVEGVLKHEPDGTGWKSDATAHWHICRCGDVIDKAEHDFEWVVDTPATVEAKGSRHQECKVCGAKGKTEGMAILPPSIVEGAGQTLTKTPTVPVGSDLTVRSNAPLSLFKKVLVDGTEVASDNYTLRQGSTIVTLKAAYLATLKVGEHKLSVVSESGTAETTFSIAEQQEPADGGNGSGSATGGNGGAAKPDASKGGATKKGGASKGGAGKSTEATMPSVGDGATATVAAMGVAGILAVCVAVQMLRRHDSA